VNEQELYLLSPQATAWRVAGQLLIGLQLYYWCFLSFPDVIHESVRKRLQYVKTIIPAGQILKLLAVFEDVCSTHSNGLSNKRLSLPLIGRSHNNTRYAQCLNHKNQVIKCLKSTNWFRSRYGDRHTDGMVISLAYFFPLGRNVG